MKVLVKYCKQIEALGLALLISAAILQFRADAIRRDIVAVDIHRVSKQVEFNRMHVARLFKCSRTDNCNEFHYDHIKPEASAFSEWDLENPEPDYRKYRLVIFILGSFLVCTGKSLDLPRTGAAQ